MCNPRIEMKFGIRFLSEKEFFDLIKAGNKEPLTQHYGKFLPFELLSKYLIIEDPNTGKNALMLAISMRHQALSLELLNRIKERMDKGILSAYAINKTDRCGLTSLMYAIAAKEPGIALKLIELGADINIQTTHLDPTLAGYTNEDKPKIVLHNRTVTELANQYDTLTLNEVEIKKGFTALHFAIAFTTELTLIKKLLDQQINLNLRDCDGFDPLLRCVKEITTIVAKAASLENPRSSNAYFKSKIAGPEYILDFLLKNIHQLTLHDKNGETVLDKLPSFEPVPFTFLNLLLSMFQAIHPAQFVKLINESSAENVAPIAKTLMAKKPLAYLEAYLYMGANPNAIIPVTKLAGFDQQLKVFSAETVTDLPAYFRTSETGEYQIFIHGKPVYTLQKHISFLALAMMLSLVSDDTPTLDIINLLAHCTIITKDVDAIAQAIGGKVLSCINAEKGKFYRNNGFTHFARENLHTIAPPSAELEHQNTQIPLQ